MEPVTRKGMFLDAICDGEPCNLEPATREEIMLKRLAENSGGSGGSGGGSGGGANIKHILFHVCGNSDDGITSTKTFINGVESSVSDTYDTIWSYAHGENVATMMIVVEDDYGDSAPGELRGEALYLWYVSDYDGEPGNEIRIKSLAPFGNTITVDVYTDRVDASGFEFAQE